MHEARKTKVIICFKLWCSVGEGREHGTEPKQKSIPDPKFENENSGGDRNLNRFKVFGSETTFAETNLSGFDLCMDGEFVALKGAAPIATYIFYAIQIKQKLPAL